MVVERLKSCDNIVALAQELGLHRRLLYKWREQLEPVEHGEPVPSTPELRQQVRQLKRLLAEKTDGSGFSQGCLAKSRGSTPAEQQLWRDDIYDQVREVMSRQGSLSIERMCQLVAVSRAGFYPTLSPRTKLTPAHEEQGGAPRQPSGIRSALQRPGCHKGSSGREFQNVNS